MPHRKFTKDIGIVSLANLAIALKTLIFLPIITKVLGAGNYGIWIQIIAAISLATPLVTMGLPYTLVRFLAAEKDKKEIQDGIYSVAAIVLTSALIVSAILLFFSSPISNFLGGEKILIQMLAFIIIFECLNEILFNIFRAFQQNQEYSFFISFQNFGEIALVIIMISLGYGLIGAVFALLAVRLISFLIMAIKIIKKIGIKIPEFLRIKEYLHFSLPSLPANISSWTVQSSDKYLIGIFLGANFVGYYAPAYAIGNSITFFIAPLIFILPAVLSKLYDENKIEEAKNYLKYSLKYFLMIAVPSVFGLAALSKQILTIFSTTEIAQKSYYIVPMVAFAILLLGIYSIVAQTIVLKKKTRTIGIIWVIAAFLNIGLNIILVPIFGIVAAAITTIAGYAFALMAAVYYSLSNFRFEIDWKFIIKSVFASILMYIFVLSLNPADLSKTIMTVVGGAIFYGIIMFFLKGIDEKEIKFLKGFFKRA